MTQLGNRLFAAAFSRLLVYTILFEDNDQDRALLALDNDDKVFSIGGAGCGVAALLAAHPASIDVIDSNRKHLSLAALKINAARRLRSYDELHELLALGRHNEPQKIVRQLVEDLPSELAAFWRSHWRMFKKDFYAHGLAHRSLSLVRRAWPMPPEHLRYLNTQPKEQRAREAEEQMSKAVGHKIVKTLVNSPVGLLAAGINFTQRDRNLRALGVASQADIMVDFAKRVAHTDLTRNWVLWHIIVGHFNHDEPDCLPPYLRREFHARSLSSPTQIHYHHATLGQRLAQAPDEHWSRFCLSDVPDWMNNEQRLALLNEIHRTAKPGARVVYRTVENTSIADQLNLKNRFRLLEPESTVASENECSCLYNRVNCYEVLK